MQGFTCTFCVVWKLLPSSQNLTCLALSCLRPEGAGSKTEPRIPWTGPRATLRGMVLEPSPLRLEEGSRVRLRKRLKPSGITTNRTASTSHFELTCIWAENNSFLILKLAKCWSANISGLIVPCTNWNIHFYSSSLKVEQTSKHLDSMD